MIEKKIVKDRKLAKSVRKISDADFNYASKLLDESKKKFTLTDLLLTNVPDSQASLQTEVIRAWILNCKTVSEKGLKKAAYNDMDKLFRLPDVSWSSIVTRGTFLSGRLSALTMS